MQYLSEQIRRDWEGRYVSPFPERLEKLKKYIGLLDELSRLLGAGEITITSFLRTGNDWIHSLHHPNYGAAVDMRVKDKPVAWYVMMVTVLAAIERYDPHFRVNFHPELYCQNNQHIHIEIRR